MKTRFIPPAGWILIAVSALLTVPVSAADVATSFEFTISGTFTRGDSPNSVTFTNGRAQSLGVPSLYRPGGTHAWMINPGTTGTITMETPAENVSFWYKDENTSVASVITVFDDNDQVVQVLNGTQVYQPAAFNGQRVKRITFQNNGSGGSRPVLVVDDFSYTAVTGPANEPPTAAADEAATIEETSVTINVTGNDSDPENDPLSVTAVSDPPNGTAALDGNNVVYTPDDGFFGQDQFTYTLSDGQGNSVQGQITVTVAAFEPTLVFPQFVNGLAAGQNSSRIVLRNTDDDTNLVGFIRFRTSMGSVPVGGNNVNRIDFDINPFGVFEVSTDGDGEFQVGIVEIVITSGDDSRAEGTLVFFLLGTFVSVDAAPVRSQHQVFVSAVPIASPAPDPDTLSEKAGVAAYNPDEENTATLHLVLLDETGTERASRTTDLAPRTQLVAFVDQEPFFPEFFADNPQFSGSLNITVTDGPDVSVVGLIQKGSGALIAFATGDRAFLDQ